ncbi:MAG TPA: aminotransferase class I/II-fold pyridoxal phosphate-dependent enzyme [Pararhizobium sp.]|nr:aminotransferase class I/II-fold pyridoxal phosphate-dependent enzyme [Pararhizobium sp.]
MTGNNSGGDGDVRGAVLDFMRKRDQGMPAERRSASAGMTPPSFADLPEYRRVVAQQGAGELLQLSNPFHRVHDGSAGPTTTVDGAELSNFASYDYLGLNRHPTVLAAADEAIGRYGVSASASRLVAGERPVHEALERRLARHYGVEAAVAFVSGYLTNVTVIAALVGPQDLIVHDELIHNSVLAGAKLSGAMRRSFRHNDLGALETLLTSVSGQYRRMLVVVEGVYSMDGDVADLPRLIELRARHGFWLMVDEAHALGVLGETGRGSFEHHRCDPRTVDIWMGTLSKATASCGGYIAGSEALATLVKASAGGFVFSVGLAPALAAAGLAALEVLEREPERVRRLHQNGRRFLEAAQAAGLSTGTSLGYSVIPVIVGDSIRAVQLSNELSEAGINVLPIIHPAVPEGMARLRFFITSEHSEKQIDEAVRLTTEKLKALEARNFGIGSVDVSALLKSLSAD